MNMFTSVPVDYCYIHTAELPDTYITGKSFTWTTNCIQWLPSISTKLYVFASSIMRVIPYHKAVRVISPGIHVSTISHHKWCPNLNKTSNLRAQQFWSTSWTSALTLKCVQKISDTIIFQQRVKNYTEPLTKSIFRYEELHIDINKMVHQDWVFFIIILYWLSLHCLKLHSILFHFSWIIKL